MSVDLRTRSDGEQRAVDAADFFDKTLPAQLDANRTLILPGAKELPLNNFCIQVEDKGWTLSWQEDYVVVQAGNSGEARVVLTQEQFSDIVNDQSTPIALMSNRVLEMPEGGLPDFLNWWLVLRSALDRRPIHKKGDVTFSCDVRRSFTPEDSDEAMKTFLEEVGYLHIKGLFTQEEMQAVAEDFPKIAPHFQKGDPKAWFVTLKDGSEELVRMEGFDRYSAVTSQLVNDERFLRIGRITGVGHVPAGKPGSRVGALHKPIGVVKGISDVPWHKDCSLGRHSYECCSLTVGISVDGADTNSGQLRVVPGSHRALIWPAPCLQPGLDLEPIDLPTETGDVTVHLSCTQHMSQPPVTHTRKVLYTGFSQTPLNAEAAEANRQRLNRVRSKTHTRISQEPGYLGD